MQGIHANYYASGSNGTDLVYDRSHIVVTVRSVYGNDLVYPADDTAARFASLVGAKTFNARQLAAIRELGFAVRVASGTLPEGF